MSNIKYPGIVRAARARGEATKDLAEQLFLEIPPRRGRPPAGAPNLETQLREAAEEILRETGEDYNWETLKNHRKVAAWVFEGNGDVNVPISWADASWTAHVEAYQKGIPWAEFVAGKRTKRAVREQAGASTGDVPAAARAINAQHSEAEKLVEGMTITARVALQRALEEAEADPGTERMMRRMKSEKDAWEAGADRGEARGGEHEVKAMLEVQWLHDNGHRDGVQRVVAFGQGLLDLEQIQDLTPEMFHE